MTLDPGEITRANRGAWDASARYHLESDLWQKSLDGFAQPGYSEFDATITQLLQNIPVAGKSVVQIGCNNGREILSAISLGASQGLGLDQSAEFLKQAETLKAVSGYDCEFLCADVYQLPAEFNKRFDVGLITIGVLSWLPDLNRFFKTVARLLNEDATLLIYETHPFLEMFDPRSNTPHLPTIPYFNKSPFVSDEAITYDETVASVAMESYWFNHTVSDIINAVIGAGLRIESFNEYPHSNRETEYDIYANRAAQVPMCYSLVACKGL